MSAALASTIPKMTPVATGGSRRRTRRCFAVRATAR